MRVNFSGVVGELTTLPGCSQIGVSHSVFVPEHLRGNGLGKKANIDRVNFAKTELGYDGLVCTVDDENLAQVNVMISCGWQKAFTFKSSKTGHSVSLWFIC